jgi:hypothetical protein
LLLPRALKTQSTITMGVLGLLRAQALSNTNQSPQKWKQFNRKAFGVYAALQKWFFLTFGEPHLALYGSAGWL